MALLTGDDGRWRPAAELVWLALWACLLGSACIQVGIVSPRLQHHVFESVLWGGVLLGIPISGVVALVLVLLALAETLVSGPAATSSLSVAPSAPPALVIFGYWAVFFVPGVLQRWRRLPIAGSLVAWCAKRIGRGNQQTP
jgi:hypothetical protein